jgi:uncharacterized BrkB/YihY/UPF0761 family membrane protein
MLYLIGLIVLLGAAAAYMLTKKHPEAPVVTTSEDKKPAGWMDLGGDPNADKYTSKVNEALQSSDVEAKTRKTRTKKAE